MSNTFGKLFSITTFGESHGKALGVIVDGCPAGLEILLNDIQKELDRRKPGQSDVTTSRKEEDRVEILSGILDSKTLGTPIAMLIYNKDAKSDAYEKNKDLFRPGHADYTYQEKYGIRDVRGGGRASGRETAARVAAGAIAKKLLLKSGINIVGYVVQIAGEKVENIDESIIESNPVRCPDKNKVDKFMSTIENAKKHEDSVGGVVEVVAHNVPAGLGEPVFNKLSADLSFSVMSIPAVKGVEIGNGFVAANLKGSENNDEFVSSSKSISTKTNNAGGILGGISNGEDIVLRFAVKPTSSIGKEQNTVDKEGRKQRIKVLGRHDPCICPRVVPVGEAMVALVLADHLLLSKLSKI